jgi:hypothetical protein
MDASRCDYLFVLVADGRRWFIPSDRVGGGNAILLGGPKYAGYEVKPGRPLRRDSQGDGRLYNRVFTSSGGCPSG